MVSLNTRVKSALLVLATFTTTTSPFIIDVSFPSVDLSVVASYLPSKKLMLFAIAFIAWVRLQTKKTYDYQVEEWDQDVETLMKSFDIFDITTYENIANFIDKWVIGRKLSIIDVDYETYDEETGTLTILKDKYLKTKPFGALGLLDAYVLGQFKKVNETTKEMDLAKTFYDNF